MKKVTFVSLSLMFFFVAQAQRVGINVPSPTEDLHVDSVIKVGKNAALGTQGRKNLVKFGDNNYVTIGEEQVDDKLYIRYGDLVFLPSSGLGAGNIGIKTELPTADLDVNGTLRLRSGAPAEGKVLTSDANGNASWQPPVTGNNVGFSAYLSASLPLADDVTTDITGYTENFDDGNVFSPANGRFTAPSAGVYQISFNVNFLEGGTATKYLKVGIEVNGSLSNQYYYVVSGLTSNAGATYSNSVILKLSQSDYVSLNVTRSQSGGSTLRGGNFVGSTYFTVHKVY